MSASLVRIALLQFVTVIVSVFIAGSALKMRFGSGSHYPFLATYVRDYGIVLLLLPFAWGVWGAVESNRPKTGLGEVGGVFATGVALLVALIVFGLVSFISAISYGTVIQVTPPPQSTTQPAIARS